MQVKNKATQLRLTPTEKEKNMPELAEVETQKTAGFVDRGYNYEKKRSRMEAE